MFCAATGFAGTPKVGTGRFEAERLVPVEGARRIKVHFNADRSEQLPWTFTPQQKFVSVLPGETSLAFYRAKNNSKRDVIGIATYNVTPDRVRSGAVCVHKRAYFPSGNRLHRTFRKWSVFALRSRSCWRGKKSICHFCSSSTRICWTTPLVGMLMTLCYRIRSFGMSLCVCKVIIAHHYCACQRSQEPAGTTRA
jgi:hypothetical protein